MHFPRPGGGGCSFILFFIFIFRLPETWGGGMGEAWGPVEAPTEAKKR